MGRRRGTRIRCALALAVSLASAGCGKVSSTTERQLREPAAPEAGSGATLDDGAVLDATTGPTRDAASSCGQTVTVLLAPLGRDAGACAWAFPLLDGRRPDPKFIEVAFEDDTRVRYLLPMRLVTDETACAGLGQDGGVYYDDPSNPTAIIGCPNVCTLPFGSSTAPGGFMRAVIGCMILGP